ISGSPASRSRKRCSQLSENITLVGSRRYAAGTSPAGNVSESVFTLRLDVLVDPGDDHVGELKIVAILHQHVTVPLDAELGQIHHLGVAAGSLDLLDIALAGGERVRPVRGTTFHVTEMVAEHDQVRNL